MYRLGIVWKVCIQEASMVHLCQYSLMIESYPADFEAYSLKHADEQLSMCFLEFRRDPHLELIFFFYFYCTMKTRESELKVEMSSGISDVVILPKPSECQVAWREASRW